MREPARDKGRLENMAEAAFMLTTDLKQKHPEIPWEQIVGMRHVLVHDYSTVMPEILWHTATIEIPELIPQLKELMEII